ncbi:MAG: kinase/pyrophosphorylase [Tissierellia bacterium]|nr:kinase/pyrophosphorylase [Tissierellia bacterium]
MNNEHSMVIYVVSDSIGETGELIAKASIKQFETSDFEIKRFPYTNTVKQLEPMFKEAAEDGNAIIFYTTVENGTREYIQKKAAELNIKTVDIMGEPLIQMEKILKKEPLREPGLIRRLDENYFKKVESVEFAVKYDDGKDPRGAKNADICLVGISRTSKTPLSMYLANKLYKVANIPLVPEVPVPSEVYEKDPRRVIGLIANPLKINAIREERLKALGLGSNASYANIDRIRQEIEYSKKVMEELGCIVIDVSNKAIEETAGIIIEHMEISFEE